jgi:UDP-glucuronate 4-epimerase
MRRDFTHVSDIADGVIKSLESGLDFEIFNLGNSEQVELSEVIESLEKSIGKTAKKELLPMQPGDVPGTHSNIDKARKMLGFEPKVSINEGIKEFFDWYKEFYSEDTKI